jgi:two-component system CheB/CheR fusion protein
MIKIKASKKSETEKEKGTLTKLKSNARNPFTVVAIGSSAGGLEAGSELFKHLPADTGMAYIYVQHLSPTHKSFLSDILSKTTKMKVQEIENMEEMAPNNIYVIPNDKGIKVTNGHIKLIPRSKSGTAISIDVLFSSLAATHKENVIGVILSGNAHDGTIGLKAIKKAGGITFAQDNSAQASSMPNSAIQAGVVDYILSPKKIAHSLVNMGKKRRRDSKMKQFVSEKNDKIKSNDPNLRIVMEILLKEIHVDFKLYKIATIERRIRNRMLQSNINTLKEYVQLISKSKKEIALLYKDLLIHVTSFFRDAETFQYLKSTFFPKFLKNNANTDILRLWVPACSTGDEVYSIAMLLTELQENERKKHSFQIFATDLSEQAINIARTGEYGEADLRTISKKRLARFFIKTGDTYRIVKELREMCVFASHNILSDPPFSRIDFISCRNLLIYFDSVAQKKALKSIYFALNEGAYLMLGKSETTGTSSTLFNPINAKFRIYSRKKNTGIRILPELTYRFRGTTITEKTARPQLKKTATFNSIELDHAVDSELLSRYMPTCVVINKSMEILKFRGLTAVYLSHPSGNACLNILKMIRPEFAFELRNAIQESVKTNKSVLKSEIELTMRSIDTLSGVLSIEVRPMKIDWGEPLFMVVFTIHKEVERFIETTKDRNNNSAQKDRKIKRQMDELNKTSSEMALVIESQDRAYEELQAANEEIISASEEFQTLNEELETSKEEIEATNEELLTTNQELRMRNEQLAESHDFSEAVSETMHEPMLILDKHLMIKSANTAFYKKFHMHRAVTEGKLLYELGAYKWDIPGLRLLLENIVQKNAPLYDYEISHEFPEIGKKIMLLNARKIVQKTQNEQLILLTFIDITERAKKRILEKQELEDIISERTKALAESHKSLEAKNIFLEKMNKELETFTFLSSHDLQEPLRKIRMLATCLLDEENKRLSNSGQGYLKRMQDIVVRMQSLIQDLLTYANAKKIDYEFQRGDLNKVAEEVIANFQDMLAEKKGKIKSEGFCHAHIMGLQFRQVLDNLISNALKFADPRRAPRIIIKSKISSGRELNKKGLSTQLNYCHISVADNGIGFDPKYKDQIFEVFQRLHGQKEYKGTGIGLAICKRIIENHNGLITATGILNKGTQIDMYIPASED